MQNVWNETLAALKQDNSYRNMFRLMEKFKDDVAGEMLDENGKTVSRTYREYVKMSKCACGKLQNLGIKPAGDVIALSYDTCMDWPVLLWGILMSGNIPLLLNPSLDAKLLCAIMNEARASAYVSAKPIVGADARFIDSEPLLNYDTEGEEYWGKYVALCTSGTTQNSRIFLYGSETIANHIISFDEAKMENPDMPFIEGKPCKLLAFLPFHHVFGFSVVYLLYSCTGKTLVYLRDKSINTITGTCQKLGVTHLYCIPMFFNAMAKGILKKLDGKDIHRLSPIVKEIIKKKTLGTKIRSMITGGGHIPESTLDVINSVGYPLCNGFGMTETGIISVERSLDAKQRICGSIGVPFTLTEWKINSEDGVCGELLIRGGALYTASMIGGKIVERDKNAWFATGDVVVKKENGLFITGRSKDVIINASGENIYPEELEDRYSDIAGVSGFCVLGVPDGQYEKIALVMQIGSDADENGIIEKVKKINEDVQPSERVVGVYFTREPLPISGSLKIKRLALRDEICTGKRACDEYDLYKKGGAVKAAAASIIADPAENTDEYKALLAEIKVLSAKYLDKDISEIGDTDHYINVLGSDSLTVLGIFSELEEKYSFVITDEEIRTLDCCRNVALYVYGKLYGQAQSIRSIQSDDIETHRITDFAESEEFKNLKSRMSETFKDGNNPYFIPHDSLIRDTSVIDGKRVINLGSYNYLGMSGNPETMQAAIEAIKEYGTSASGSRTLAGEKTIYRALEKAIAQWKHTDDAIVATGGWATNLTFISSFMKKGDFVVYDKLSHNSLTEGVKLSDADSKAFEHNNLAHLERILQQIDGKYNKVLIVVEGVYSMDGDIAPIPEFVALKKKYKCFLMVDEAHSGGVLGDAGGGVDDYFHLDPSDIDIKYGTLSKALGTCGGFIAADKNIVEYLRYNMNGFVFSAGIAPPLAAAAMKAIEIIRKDNTEVTKLHRNIEYFVRRAKEEGMDTCLAGESGIVPILIGDDAQAAKISSLLLGRGVFVPPAMYPAVPMGQSRLRFTVSSTHSIEQLEKAITETAKVMRDEGVLK